MGNCFNRFQSNEKFEEKINLLLDAMRKQDNLQEIDEERTHSQLNAAVDGGETEQIIQPLQARLLDIKDKRTELAIRIKTLERTLVTIETQRENGNRGRQPTIVKSDGATSRRGSVRRGINRATYDKV